MRTLSYPFLPRFGGLRNFERMWVTRGWVSHWNRAYTGIFRWDVEGANDGYWWFNSSIPLLAPFVIRVGRKTTENGFNGYYSPNSGKMYLTYYFIGCII